MPRHTEKALAELFGMDGWKPMGLHPMVGASILDLKTTKHEHMLQVLRYDGLIERSQCTLFGQWLHYWKKGDRFDYILRLDEDIEFHPSAIQSMIDADKPIIGGAYAYKADSGSKFKKSVCKYLPGRKVSDEKGILQILWLNGGFQFFRSDALFKLMEAYPSLRYDRVPEGGCDCTESYALWTDMIKEMDTGENKMRILLSEDYAICQRAIDIGIDIYLDMKVNLCHWDTHIPDPEDEDDYLRATGYMVGADPIVVTERSKPWRQNSSMQTTLSAV
jgi:hypothetical protein